MNQPAPTRLGARLALMREFVDRTPRPVIEKPFELSILAEAVRNLRT